MAKARKSKDAQSNGAVYAHSGGAFVAAGAVSMDANGQPRRSYIKDLIPDGTWFDAAGNAHLVTPERRARWVDNFAKMSAAGVEVPVPEEHANMPSDRRGTVRRVWNDGDRLMGEIELVGDDAIKLASTTKVSIYAPKSVRLGDGTVLEDAIEHVALTDYPVVSGQDGFIPIAASRVPVCRLGRQESPDMNWKSIAETIGFSVEGLTDETGPAKVDEALKVFAAKATQTTAEATTLAASLKTANDSLAKAKLPEIDPDIIQSRGELIEVKLSALVDSGKITPKVKNALKELCTTGATAGLCLSKRAAEAAGFKTPIADSIIAILADNAAADMKASTGIQSGTVLSRVTPGGKSGGGDAVNLLCDLSGVKRPA